MFLYSCVHIMLLNFVSWTFCWLRRVASSDMLAFCSSSSLSTLILQDLHLIWAALMSSQRAKQLLSADGSHSCVHKHFFVVLEINILTLSFAVSKEKRNRSIYYLSDKDLFKNYCLQCLMQVVPYKIPVKSCKNNSFFLNITWHLVYLNMTLRLVMVHKYLGLA